MKRFFSFVVLVAMLMFAVSNANAISGTFSAKTHSKYICGLGTVAHDGPVTQIDLFVNLPKGFYGEAWLSTGIDFKSNFGREVDYSLGWSNSNFDVGLCFIDVVPVFTGGGVGDIVMPYAKVSYSLFGVTPFVKGEYFHVLVNTSTNSAPLFTVGVDYKISFHGNIANIQLKPQLVYDGGVYDAQKRLVRSLRSVTKS